MKEKAVMQDSELEYVGFWARALAVLIDTILMMIVMAPFARYFDVGGYYFYDYHVSSDDPSNFWISFMLPAVIVIGFWSVKDATPGKMLIGARIVDARTGAPPTLKQHIIRYLGYFLSSFVLCLGFIWAAFDRRKQAWHDKLAGTVVVRRKRRGKEPVRFEH
jgi:uncharacterized RDD family membrane protein YckC